MTEYTDILEAEAKLKRIAEHYGFTSQANMLTEEAAEYTVALNKLRRGNTDAYDNIKEEVADVLVIALQLRELLGAERIDEIIHQKVDRQLSRIQAENVWANEQLPNINIIETPEITQRFITDFNKDKLTKEFWERKAKEPPTDKCIIEEDWAAFGKRVAKENDYDA